MQSFCQFEKLDIISTALLCGPRAGQLLVASEIRK